MFKDRFMHPPGLRFSEHRLTHGSAVAARLLLIHRNLIPGCFLFFLFQQVYGVMSLTIDGQEAYSPPGGASAVIWPCVAFPSRLSRLQFDRTP